jgi:hypothetical protein
MFAFSASLVLSVLSNSRFSAWRWMYDGAELGWTGVMNQKGSHCGHPLRRLAEKTNTARSIGMESF